MKFKTARKATLLTLILVITVLPIFALNIQKAHAVTPLSFVGSQQNFSCGGGGCTSALTVVSGDLIIAQEWFAGCSTVSDSMTSNPSETWTQTQSFGGGYEVWSAIAHTSTSYVMTFACVPGPTGSGDFSVANFRGTFNGFGSAVVDQNGGIPSGTDVATITVQSGSLIYEGFLAYNNNIPSNCPTQGGNSGQTNRMNHCGSVGSNSFGDAFWTTGPTVGAGQLSLSVSWNCNAGGLNCGPVRHSLLELTSATASQIGTTTVCNGNCGNPAVTLTNPNATHSIAFNTSITILYEFQAQANGFIVNETTNIGKTYTNGQQAFLGIYTISSCPTGVTPFSLQCPGQLQRSIASPINPTKGTFSQSGTLISVATGQWVGIAVSAFLTGLDLNETNVVCGATGALNCANPPGMVQTSGSLPAVISQTSTISVAGISQTGLWAYITSAIVPSQPGPSPFPNGGACPGIDCILTAVVNGFCTTLTSQCQTSSALLWIVVLSLITIFVMIYTFSNIAPTVNLSRVGIGEMAILIFLAWTAIFASLSLLASWVIILIFFMVSLLFGKKVTGYI